MKITLLTGTAGDIQGWGNMETTHALASTLKQAGKEVDILFVNHYADLFDYLDTQTFDLIWSSLYHISNNENSIDIPLNDQWVQDYLDQRQIPYVGSSASSLKTMLNKHDTYTTLKKHNIPVPEQYYIESLDVLTLPKLSGKFIVKPCYGSNSTGIDELSIVDTPEALKEKVEPILTKFSQPVIVEEYLPMDEYTVLVLGNGEDCQLQSVINKVDSACYQQYPIITSDLKAEHGITFHKPTNSIKKMAENLAYQTATALGCLDHVRIDMRMDREGQLKVIDVNGIPGMSPVMGSRSLAIQMLYNPQYDKSENHSRLTNRTVDSAMDRYITGRAAIAS